MGITDLFNITCTISRYTEGAQDEVGQPDKTWADHLTDVACRLVAAPMGAGREMTIGVRTVVAEYILYLGVIDVTERDEVIIGAITYEILLITAYSAYSDAHHKKVYLRTLR